METLRDWNPINYENLYISAGLIDCNVRINEDWESSSTVTKCAISGGVTSIAVESLLYRQSLALERLYCDVGLVQVVAKRKQAVDCPNNVLALKTYFCAPSCYVEPGLDDLSDLLSEASKKNLPLIVDVSMPTPRMLFMASPYRNTVLEDRTHYSPTSEPTLAAGAFPQEIHSSSSSESGDDENHESPGKTVSSVELQKMDGHLTESPKPSLQLSMALPILQVPSDDRNMNRRLSKRTLADGLTERVKMSKDDISILSTAEQKGYLGAGRTFFEEKAELQSAPVSCTVSVPAPDVKVLSIKGSKMFQNRMQRMRPTLLQVVSEEREEETKDSIYLNHLANCPEHWETLGVDFLLSELKKTQCRVHICNLSSSAAVNRLFSVRRKIGMTCETCPHYLAFSMEGIADGDTRMKTFPPIRNTSNKNLLWEMLKAEGIDIIASHHTSVPSELKVPIPRSFKRALNGINNLGFTLSSLWTELKPPRPSDFQHYFVRMTKWLSFAPAKMLGVSHLKGELRAGLHADIVVWAPYEEFVGRSLSRLGNLSPYAGKALFGRVHRVYLRGKVAMDADEFEPVGRVLEK